MTTLSKFITKTEEEFNSKFPQYDGPPERQRRYINEEYQEFISTKLRQLAKLYEDEIAERFY